MADVSPATLYSTLFPKKADRRSLYNAMDDEWEVGQILPIQRNRLTGDYGMAVPQMASEAMRFMAAPGKAARGEYGLAADENGRVSYDGMAEDAAGLAGSVTLGAGAIPGQGLGMGFRVFHGSPHDFDKFDMSKMGTGEGAQAYGRGLYFAENPEVAGSYKAALSQLPFADGDPANVAWNLMNSRANGEEMFRKSYAGKLSDAEMDDAISRAKSATSGRLYEAEIDAETDDFLDWDDRLSPEIFERLTPERLGLRLSENDNRFRWVTDEGKAVGYRIGYGKPPPLFDESEIGASIHRNLTDAFGSEDAAAAALKRAGIPGIRYLDQSSRGKGDGSRNFVVFDDSLIDIKSKK